MPRTFVIQIPAAESDPAKFVHRVRNFAEDLHRTLVQGELGSVPNEDSAAVEVQVHLASGRMFGDAQKIARALLRRHHLDSDAKIV